MADFYRVEDDDSTRLAIVDKALVGEYDYIKGGSSETFTQEISLLANGSMKYKGFHETASEKYTRVGHGTWGVIAGGQIVLLQFKDLTKDTKVKNKFAGLKDEVKTDHGVALDIKFTDLSKAPPSGPAAPKSRWRKKN